MAQADRAHLAFEEMKTYVGTWERVGVSRENFRILYSLTANGSVLVETWMRGDKVHSLTVYHMDDSRLLSTHYCPQGNLPRLALVHDGSDVITFDYLDGTNIDASGNPYQSGASFALGDSGDSMVRGEIYASDEGDSPSSITLQRYE